MNAVDERFIAFLFPVCDRVFVFTAENERAQRLTPPSIPLRPGREAINLHIR